MRRIAKGLGEGQVEAVLTVEGDVLAGILVGKEKHLRVAHWLSETNFGSSVQGN
jgi:hypothetical protein